jgi:Tol biopolymer transport system component
MSGSQFSASSTDRLVYLTGQARRYILTWLDRTGRALEPNPGFSIGVPWVELGPDLRRVLTTESNGRTTEAVSIVDLSRGAATRITPDPAAQSGALWLPGGNSVLFGSNRGGKIDLNWMPLSTGASQQVLYQSDEDKYPIASSPDGRKLVYWVVPPHPAAPKCRLLDSAPGRCESAEGWHASPTRTGSGRGIQRSVLTRRQMVCPHPPRTTAEEIFIIDVAGRGHRYQVSTASGVYPRWKGTAKELFYLTLDGKMMSAPIQVRGDALDVGTPTPLFDTHQAPRRIRLRRDARRRALPRREPRSGVDTDVADADHELDVGAEEIAEH